MKALVIYGSSFGNTRHVVGRLPSLLGFDVAVAEARTLDDASLLDDYDTLLFFASTWGDGELQVDMERFLVRQPLDLRGKRFAICELGNYYGYEDFAFGAERIMRHVLEEAGATELVEPFSMDSLPYKDWLGLERWCSRINAGVREIE